LLPARPRFTGAFFLGPVVVVANVGYARHMRTLIGIIIFSLGLTVWASDQVYKKINEDGTVEYSDRPIEGAERIKVPKGSTYSAPPVTTSKAGAPGQSQAEPEFSYQRLAILEPKNDAQIRSNQGNVSAMAEVSPGLQAGHKFQWLLDNQPLVGMNSLKLKLQNVDRGTHTLQLTIIDSDGKQLMASDKVTFHLLRHSAANPFTVPPPRPK